MAERVFTWVTNVDATGASRIEKVLAEEEPSLMQSLERLPMLHFASLTLFPPREGAAAWTLIFECNIDGPPRAYIDALVANCIHSLDAIYGGVDGYPHQDDDHRQAVGEFLNSRLKRATLYHVGHPRRSVQAIVGDRELRRSIEHELKTNVDLRELSPIEQLGYFRERAHCPHRWAPSAYPWPRAWEPVEANSQAEHEERPPGTPTPPTPLECFTWVREGFAWERIESWIALLFAGLVFEVSLSIVLARAVGTPFSVSFLLAGLVILVIVQKSVSDTRWLNGLLSALVVALLTWWALKWLGISNASEVPDWLFFPSLVPVAVLAFLGFSFTRIGLTLQVVSPTVSLDRADRLHLRELMEVEDRLDKHSIYNHVTGYSILKNDRRPWRQFRTRLVLVLLNLFYRTYFSKGKLATIPSIHFAQWQLVDDHVLFMTNYDGSADSYLDDFFNSLAQGVAFIWYDTQAFPRTSDPRRLKLWVRGNQVLAKVRYRAPVYEGLTVEMVNTNTRIRNGIIGIRRKASAQRWLRYFGCANIAEPSLLSRVARWFQGLFGPGSALS